MSETDYYSETPKRLIYQDIPRVKRRLNLSSSSSSLNVRPYPTSREWEETCVVPKVADIIQHFESLSNKDDGRLGRTIIVGADDNADAYWEQVSDVKVTPSPVTSSSSSSNGVFRNDSRSSGIVSDFDEEEEDSSIPEDQITKEEEEDVDVEAKDDASDAINYEEIPRIPPILLSPPTPFKDSKPPAVGDPPPQPENDDDTVVSRLKIFLVGGGLLALYILLLGKSPFSSSRGSFWFSFGAVILNAFLYYHFVLRRNSGGVMMEDAQGSSSSKIQVLLVYFLHPAYFLRCGDEVTPPVLGIKSRPELSLSDSGFLDDDEENEDVAHPHPPEGQTITPPPSSRQVKGEMRKFGFVLPVLYVLSTTLEFVWMGVLPMTGVISQLPALFLVFHVLPQFLNYVILLHLD